MLFKNVFESCKRVPQVIKAADNETLNGAGVDMSGYEGVAFTVLALKGEALNFTIKAQEADESDFSDAADLAGTSVAFSTAVGTDGYAMLDIFRPQKQYVRPVVVVPNATAATPVSVEAIQYGGRFQPETNTGELHTSPDEGTA
jgi:hypothetical protein